VTFQTYGTGLAGSGGFVPLFTGENGSCHAGGHSVTIEHVLGGAAGTLFVGIQPADQFPVFGGHFLLDIGSPFIAVPVSVFGLKGLPGAGAITIPGGDLNGLGSFTIYLQYLATDPGAPFGVSMSNGLSLNVE
jgi:hypothetical protein